MFYNYLITAFRNFKKNKFYVFVSVFGLSLGIMCCLVLFTILRHELTFDKFHENRDNIYRIVRHVRTESGMHYGGMLPNPMGLTLYENKRLIEDVITLHGPEDGTIEFDHNQQHHIFRETGVLFTNSSFLDQLDFKIITGRSPEALDEMNKVFLTEKLAKKYFSNDNPIGRFITFDEKFNLEIVGILEDSPTNTNTPFNMLVSYTTFYSINKEWMESWGSYSSAFAYVVTRPDDDHNLLVDEINKIASLHLDQYTKDRTTFILQPLGDIHTNEMYEGNTSYVLPSQVLYGSIALVLIILLISILNFINLATAQAVMRSKEVGIRKTLGGTRNNLVMQFISETFFLVVIAGILAFTIGQYVIAEINSFVQGVSFEIGYDQYVLFFAIPLLIVVTVLSGFYPALILSNYNPVTAIRNQITLTKTTGKFSVRKSLVVFQFTIANLLIIVTLIVSSQMNLIKTMDLGFDQEHVYKIQLPDRLIDRADAIKTEYKSLSYVEHVSRCMAPPTGSSNWSGSFEIVGKPQTEQMNANVKLIDQDYLNLYGIPIVLGRNISGTFYNDSTLQLIVNEDFLKKSEVSPDSAIGTTVEVFGWRGKIVGVTSNFNVYSLRSPIMPTIMAYYPESMAQLNLKLTDGNISEHYSDLEHIFRKYGPDELFEVKALSSELQRFYRLENTIYSAFKIFAAMAILIGIFGLYGMASFMSELNRKNIGIRKVFGASVFNILRFFTREFVLILLISFVIAVPFCYKISQEWLNGFEYRISIGPVYFVVGLTLTTVIVFITVGYRSYKVATANPIDSLRNE